MERFKIITVVPAYNEEKTITNVIKNLKEWSDVIVVDDNSTDQTFELAKKNNAILIKNYKNFGYEKSLEVGLLKAIELNYDFAITFDADEQHKVSDFKKFKNLIESGYDLILGNRSDVERFSEKIGKTIFYKRWGIKDPFCGFKAYNLKKVKEFNFFERYRSVGTDLSLSFIKKGYKFINVDIVASRRKDNSKFGNMISGNYKILKSILMSYFFH
jgi:glycosyltransferase involved in cell wall biosynthesis